MADFSNAGILKLLYLSHFDRDYCNKLKGFSGFLDINSATCKFRWVNQGSSAILLLMYSRIATFSGLLFLLDNRNCFAEIIRFEIQEHSLIHSK